MRNFLIVAALITAGFPTTATMAAGAAPALSKESAPAVGPDELIAHARAHNAALAAAHWRAEAAHSRIRGAAALPDPELMVSAYVQRMDTRHTVSVVQPFPFPGTLGQQRALAGAEASMSRVAAETTRLGIEQEIRLTTAEVILLEESIQLMEANIELLGEIAAVIEARVRSGQGQGSELIRAEVAQLRMEDERDRLKANRPGLVAQLNALIGREANAELPQLLPLRAILDKEMTSGGAPQAVLPDLAFYDEAILGRRAAAELARREGRPGFAAGIEWMDNQGMARDEVRVMVGVRLPVWRARYQSAIAAARAEERALEAEQLDLRRRIATEMRRQQDALADSLRRVALYDDRLLERARESLAAEEAAYRAGGSDLLSLMDTQRMLLELELSQRQSLAAAYMAAANLRRLQGDPVSPFRD